jgi:hypothetical protein
VDTVYRYFAAMYASERVPVYLKECRTVVTKMTGNMYFVSLNLDLAQVTLHLDNLDDAEQAAHHGPKGSAAKRNDALLVVRGDMRQLRSGVQLVADSDITHAQAIIESAGMYVWTRAVTSKPDLAARYGGAPGLVLLDAKAFIGQGSYEWQMSTAPGVWTDLPPGVKASILVTGLTPVTLYSFRYRTLTKVGLSDWSMVTTIIAR